MTESPIAQGPVEEPPLEEPPPGNLEVETSRVEKLPPERHSTEAIDSVSGLCGPTSLVRCARFTSTMDTSMLVPGAPDRKKQIQDAKDMYQIVARNAERAGSEPPPYKFLELIGKGAFGRVYKW